MGYSHNDTFSGLDDFSNIQNDFSDDFDSYVDSVTSCGEMSYQKEASKNKSEDSVTERHFCMRCRESLAYKYVLKEKCCEELKDWLVHHSDILKTWELTHEGNRRYPLNKYDEDFYELQLKEKILPNFDSIQWEKWKHCFVGNNFKDWEVDVPNLFFIEGGPEFVKQCGGENFRLTEDRESIEAWIINTLTNL